MERPTVSEKEKSSQWKPVEERDVTIEHDVTRFAVDNSTYGSHYFENHIETEFRMPVFFNSEKGITKELIVSVYEDGTVSSIGASWKDKEGKEFTTKYSFNNKAVMSSIEGIKKNGEFGPLTYSTEWDSEYIPSTLSAEMIPYFTELDETQLSSGIRLARVAESFNKVLEKITS
jgi:hypothetical protein